MGFVQETDVRTLLQNKTLVNNIIQAVAKAPEVMSELAEDVSDELGDHLQKDVGLPTAEYLSSVDHNKYTPSS